MEEQQHYRLLVQRYLAKQATPEELEVFAELMREGKLDSLLTEAMNRDAGLTEADEVLLVPVVKTRTLWLKIAVAASILIALSVGYVALQHQKEVKFAKIDIAPGHNQATLTLANGQKIILTKGLSGKLAQQGNVMVNVNSANGITYTPSDMTDHILTNVAYNTLTTKRGEVSPYPLVLPDGSKVWLNAASSITFPTAFYGKSRTVTVTGEAFLEVAHNAKQPFSVKTTTQTIEDIGTEFDVNAYSDETSQSTTLISGMVRVNQTTLKPGEQAIVLSNKVSVKDADIADVIAWRSGNFHFTDAKLSDILRQASRWYDVDITYENENLKDKKFGAITTRFAKASQLLHVLELTGEVKFKIEGKQITVFNK